MEISIVASLAGCLSGLLQLETNPHEQPYKYNSRSRTWHDASILNVVAVVVALLRVVVILAKRVTDVSLRRKEVRFKQK